MHPKELDKLLQDVAAGRTTCEAARDAISGRGHEGLNLDQWRFERTDVGEVVYGQGKTLEQIAASLEGLGRHHPVLATRIERDHGRELLRRFPDGCLWEDARLFSLGADLLAPDPKAPDSDVLIVTAGSSDLAVARDAGVAGLHRLEPHLESLRLARVVIAVAGMEGALPSVLGGLVKAPIVAVPTSTGYGANFTGLAPLLAMLNSCAPGVGVVNIDNGFGAAVLAKKILGQNG